MGWAHSVCVTSDINNNRIGVEDSENLNVRCACGHMALLHERGAGACLCKVLTHSASAHAVHMRKRCDCERSTIYSLAGSNWS